MKDTKQAPAVQQVTVVLDQLSHVSISDLRIASWNARKTIDTEELKSSIATHGIQVPLIVRMTLGGACEIVAGHRRFNAALALWEKGDERFDKLPCIVRELSDDQAREIGMVDNLQREDVPALEEADAYAELLLQQRLGTPAAIAARVGKDVAYVARRLQLCSLADFPRKALAERLISIDHALLLARLGVDEQDANLKWALNPNSGIKESVEETIKQRIQERDRKEVRYSGYWEPQSVLDLKHHIEQNVGRRLSRAPWSLDDATLLQDVPACNNCPSNTKHNDTLFGDLNISAATCENGLCFMAKRTAFVQLRLAEIPKETVRDEPPAGSSLNAVDRYVFPLRLSWKTSTVIPRAQRKGLVDRDGFAPDQVFRYGQWIDAKPKSCDFVRKGVTVDWSDDGNRGYMGAGEKLRKPGQMLTVCVAAKCKVHKKGYAKAKDSADNGSGNQNTEAARAARERKAELVKAENAVRAEHVKAAIAKIDKLTSPLLRRLILRGLPDEWQRVGGADEMFPGLDDGLEKLKTDSAAFARAAACTLFIEEPSGVWVNEWEPVDKGRKEFIALLKDCGHDASKAWAKPKTAAKPVAKKPAKKAAKKKGGRK